MTDEEVYLYHAGIKGMHWGENNYQTKNGTWTPLGLKRRREREGGGDGKKREGYFARKKRLKIQKQAEEKAKKEALARETVEEKRARILKSTDANELYKNRDLLTTAEINERINRIDTEAKLSKIAQSTVDTGKSKVEKFGKAVDNISFIATKVGALYDVYNKPFMKALRKQIGLSNEPEIKPMDYNKKLKNINKLSNEELKDLASRTKNEKALRSFVNELNNNLTNNNQTNNSSNTNGISEDDIRDLISEELDRRK